jgi:cell division protein FtsI/penicillin-binding protein 2
VAGKTGTAQKFIDGTYESGRYVASFAGFVPANDPQFVLVIVADEPTGPSYSGGRVAAPAFSRIAERTLKYLQAAPGAAEETAMNGQETHSLVAR